MATSVMRGKAVVVKVARDGTNSDLTSRATDVSVSFNFSKDTTEYLGESGTVDIQQCDGADITLNLHMDKGGKDAYFAILANALLKARSTEDEGESLKIAATFEVGGSSSRVAFSDVTLDPTTVNASGQKNKVGASLKFSCTRDNIDFS